MYKILNEQKAYLILRNFAQNQFLLLNYEYCR